MKETEGLSPTVLLFSGQGNPLIGMGSDLWDKNADTRRIWDCASDISAIDLRRLCSKGPMNRLVQTSVQQLAVTAINVTLFGLWRDRFPHLLVSGSCGHSVGEYSALYAAGAISLETLFRTIHFRAQTMDSVSKVNKGSMLALSETSHAALSELIANSQSQLEISCDNTPRQQVVGGGIAQLAEFSRLLLEKGHNPIKLGVSGAWHTRLMTEGVQPMRDFLAGQAFTAPQHEVLMNVTAGREYKAEKIKENLALHLTHTVRWTETLTYFINQHPQPQFIEISNKPYLAKMFSDFPGGSTVHILHAKKTIEG